VAGPRLEAVRFAVTNQRTAPPRCQ